MGSLSPDRFAAGFELQTAVHHVPQGVAHVRRAEEWRPLQRRGRGGAAGAGAAAGVVAAGGAAGAGAGAAGAVEVVDAGAAGAVEAADAEGRGVSSGTGDDGRGVERVREPPGVVDARRCDPDVSSGLTGAMAGGRR